MASLHHIALGTRDVAALAAFYRDVFSLTEVARHDYEDGSLRSVWLQVGPTILMIEHTALAPVRVDGVAPGPFLLAFDVSPQERASMVARLARAGCRVEEQTAYTAYARDPEGHRVAISHYPKPELPAPSTL